MANAYHDLCNGPVCLDLRARKIVGLASIRRKLPGCGQGTRLPGHEKWVANTARPRPGVHLKVKRAAAAGAPVRSTSTASRARRPGCRAHRSPRPLGLAREHAAYVPPQATPPRRPIRVRDAHGDTHTSLSPPGWFRHRRARASPPPPARGPGLEPGWRETGWRTPLEGLLPDPKSAGRRVTFSEYRPRILSGLLGDQPGGGRPVARNVWLDHEAAISSSDSLVPPTVAGGPERP